MRDLDDKTPTSLRNVTEEKHPGHRGLLWTATAITTAAATVVGTYGLKNNLPALKALAVECFTGAAACWLTLHAIRLRRQLAQMHELLADRTSSGVASRSFFSSDRPDVDDIHDEDDEEYRDHALIAIEQDQRLHLILLFLSTITVATVAALLFRQGIGTLAPLSPGAATTLGVLCLVLSCLCLVLARPFATMANDELPEAGALAVIFREMQWASGLIATAVFISQFWTPAGSWCGRLLLLWVFLLALEQLVWIVQSWRRKDKHAGFISPLRLGIREALFVRGNPVTGIFDTIETQWGISFRSSWAIRFVRRAALPVVCLAGFLLWGMSSLSLVGLHEMGIRESFGRMNGEPLGPGLQWKLPWPFGRVLRYPVKQVTTKPVGFNVGAKQPIAYLWTKAHSKEEFALVLGNGNEAVAVNAMVYYKIREDREGFLDYALGFQNPDVALEAYAYRVLMEQTRNSTLREVLSAKRDAFAEHLRDSLREYADENRLGIDVVEVALLNLHPPIEAAADYLAVISAKIDANRNQVEANADKLVKLQTSEKERGAAVAQAKIDAERRVGLAAEESATFAAIGGAFSVAPESFKLRSWFETFEDILGSKPLMLIDKTFTTGSGEILLDLRPNNTQNKDVFTPKGIK